MESPSLLREESVTLEQLPGSPLPESSGESLGGSLRRLCRELKRLLRDWEAAAEEASEEAALAGLLLEDRQAVAQTDFAQLEMGRVAGPSGVEGDAKELTLARLDAELTERAGKAEEKLGSLAACRDRLGGALQLAGDAANHAEWLHEEVPDKPTPQALLQGFAQLHDWMEDVVSRAEAALASLCPDSEDTDELIAALELDEDRRLKNDDLALLANLFLGPSKAKR